MNWAFMDICSRQESWTKPIRIYSLVGGSVHILSDSTDTCSSKLAHNAELLTLVISWLRNPQEELYAMILIQMLYNHRLWHFWTFVKSSVIILYMSFAYIIFKDGSKHITQETYNFIVFYLEKGTLKTLLNYIYFIEMIRIHILVWAGYSCLIFSSSIDIFKLVLLSFFLVLNNLISVFVWIFLKSKLRNMKYIFVSLNFQYWRHFNPSIRRSTFLNNEYLNSNAELLPYL